MSEIILVVMTLCNLNITNVTMPKEEKVACIEFYTNCLVGPNGTYLAADRKSCEQKYVNNKSNRSKND